MAEETTTAFIITEWDRRFQVKGFEQDLMIVVSNFLLSRYAAKWQLDDFDEHGLMYWLESGDIFCSIYWEPDESSIDKFDTPELAVEAVIEAWKKETAND